VSERRLEGHLGDADPCRIGVLGSGSTRLDPVNQSGEPLPEEREPFRLVSISISCSFVRSRGLPRKPAEMGSCPVGARLECGATPVRGK
jgi:hypothetical protein